MPKRSLRLLTLLCAVLTGMSCSPNPDAEAIERGARDYMLAHGGVAAAETEVERVEGDFARARSVPRDPDLEPAIIFLQRRGGRWQGLMYGTAFSPELYDSLRIPPRLRI